jgi:type IV secretory pathway VirB10-like protein
MAYAPAAPDLDRLPWLTDEKQPQRKNELRALVPWLLVILLVAGVSYWLGMSSPSERAETAGRPSQAPAATTRPPEPAPASPRVEVRPAPTPEVKPVQAPPVTLPRAEPVREARQAAPARQVSAKPVVRKAARAKSVARRTQPRKKAVAPLWTSWQSAGASGRMVRIGTFATRYQAKRAWHRVVRTYPGMRRLRAVVVANPSLRNGRTYYRLQFGTSSHAHSAVLCQWMRSISQSCVVVGRPSASA